MNLFFILAIVCVLYFVMILFYCGMTTKFFFFWLFLGAAFAGLGFLKSSPQGGWLLSVHTFLKNGIQAVPIWIKRGFAVLFIAGVCVFGVTEIMIVSQCFAKGRENLDYVIVLGAGVRPGGNPSKALQKRLDKAYEYALRNPDTMLILSGGKGADEPVSEADCMYDYLMRKSFDEKRLIKEEQSTSTNENLKFSRKLIPAGKSVGIISNNFHIFRAVHIAKYYGFEQVCGIAAKGDLPTAMNNFVREFFGVMKDLVIMRRL